MTTLSRTASNRNGNLEIYVMDADGTNQTRLTDDPAHDGYPSWLPGGSQIAFSSTRDGNLEIFVMDADGSNPTNLTNNLAWDDEPSWSPDGSKIAFASNRDGSMQIYVMDADGSNPTRLTRYPSYSNQPTWSPDGTKIAFHSNRNGSSEIYVMDTNGTNQTSLTRGGSFSPAWSTTGAKIAFQANRETNGQLWVMNSDGSNQSRLARYAGGGKVSWSPLAPGLPSVVAGIRPNEPSDPDAGPTNPQAFPLLISASSGGGSIITQGTLNSTPNTAFLLEFFADVTCDPSEDGERETLFGSTNVPTDESGSATFEVSFATTVPEGYFITVIATDPNGNTSEFSPCIPVQLRVPSSMQEIHSALKLEDLRSVKPSYVRGETPAFTYNLVNRSGSTLVIPLNEEYTRLYYLVGSLQHWVQRLGPDSTIPSISKITTRDAAGRYAAGVSITVVDPEWEPSFSRNFWRRLNHDTSGFPPGRYRFFVEYYTLGGEVIQTATTDFEVK